MSAVKNLLITAVLVGGYFGAKQFIKTGFSAEELASQANATMTLPAKLDSEVTLRSVTSEGNKLVFTYSMDYYNRSTLDPEIVAGLDEEDGPSMCEMVKEMRRTAKLDKRLIFARDYLNSYGTKIHSTEIAISKCS